MAGLFTLFVHRKPAVASYPILLGSGGLGSARSHVFQLQPAPAVSTLAKSCCTAAFMQTGPCRVQGLMLNPQPSSWSVVACDLQSAAEEEARMASMSADERKKYKQKQRKVCLVRWHSCIYLPCLFYQCTLRQAQHHCSHALPYVLFRMLLKS